MRAGHRILGRVGSICASAGDGLPRVMDRPEPTAAHVGAQDYMRAAPDRMPARAGARQDIVHVIARARTAPNRRSTPPENRRDIARRPRAGARYLGWAGWRMAEAIARMRSDRPRSTYRAGM